jgi:heme oxygenase
MPDPAHTIGFLQTVRQRTTELHQEIEARFNLPSRTADRERYAELLLKMLGFHELLERQFAEAGLESAAIDFAPRRKRQWLVDDLHMLGISDAVIADAPRCSLLAPPRSIAEAVGRLYVVEGSTLGGKHIAQSLKQRLNLSADNGARFFNSYGDSLGQMWRSFTTAADAYCGTDAARIEAACDGAADTFRAFGEWLGHP